MAERDSTLIAPKALPISIYTSPGNHQQHHGGLL